MNETDVHIPSTDELSRGWPARWTPGQVARFWNWQNSNPVTNELYYSKMVGRDVIRQAKRACRPQGVAVDYGAGPGYLTHMLIEQGFQVRSADVSPGSLNSLREKLKSSPGFLGGALITEAGVDLPSASADAVFFLETIEHLNNELLATTLREIRRILKPGGFLIATTPNDEDLAKSQAFCPNCGCVFHRVQHQRSFTATTLKSQLERSGFTVTHCRPTLFLDAPLWKRALYRVGHRIKNGKLPHLMACATVTQA